MTAFILTWNEKKWPYNKLRKLIDKYRRDGSLVTSWRVRANRKARPGHLFFMLKQGKDPRGIFGFGELLSDSKWQIDPDEGRRKLATVRFEHLIDPKAESLLVTLDELQNECPDWPHHNIVASGQIILKPAAEDWLVKQLHG